MVFSRMDQDGSLMHHIRRIPVRVGMVSRRVTSKFSGTPGLIIEYDELAAYRLESYASMQPSVRLSRLLEGAILKRIHQPKCNGTRSDRVY